LARWCTTTRAPSGALRASRERFAADIAASGRQVVSAFFRSPTFAGGSDLTHLGLLSGMDLSDPMRHDVLLTTQRPTLNALFRAHGYQTFGLYPALDWEWPERAFYGFDVFLARRDLGYAGPAMGFWQVPDQFSAARFEQLHPRWNGAPPRFVFFPTITCHLPFSQVPPYQPDWSRVLGPQPFDAAAVRRAQAEQPNWLNMFPDFLRMVAYTYQWLGAYLRQPSPREAIYLLIGDHQPAANITGEDGVLGCAGAYRQQRWRTAGPLHRAGFPARARATAASAGPAAPADRDDAAGFLGAGLSPAVIAAARAGRP
jgi:hypothetical protein